MEQYLDRVEAIQKGEIRFATGRVNRDLRRLPQELGDQGDEGNQPDEGSQPGESAVPLLYGRFPVDGSGVPKDPDTFEDPVEEGIPTWDELAEILDSPIEARRLMEETLRMQQRDENAGLVHEGGERNRPDSSSSVDPRRERVMRQRIAYHTQEHAGQEHDNLDQGH
jgi:hypothetical protein